MDVIILANSGKGEYKMKKRLVTILMGTMMIFSMFGCGSEANSSKDDENTETKESLVVIEPVETTKDEETEKITETTTVEEQNTQGDETKPVETSKLEETSKLDQETTGDAESVKGTNQLTDKMNEKVEVFKSYTEQQQRVNTLNTTVGGKASVWTSWSDYKIYSQDTGIAKIEGKIVYGVSEGTTYIVVECMSLMEVYKVVVKGIANSENETINIQLGTNQLTDEMMEKVEIFKCYTEQQQRVSTLKVTVGNEVAIDTAWKDYELYSQDTGIADIKGKVIYGVAKGTTYVVIECMSLQQVYKIIVE